MNFGTNVEKLEEMSGKCHTASLDINGYIDSIYTQIDSLKEDWDGESYQTFKSSCESYKSSLQTLSTILDAYSKIFNEAKTHAEELIEDVSTACNI